jgi:hypothetical protein
MPLCVAHPDCPRAPAANRRGRCLRCYRADPAVRRVTDGRGGPKVLRDPVQVLFFAERESRDQLQAHAKALGVSASEVLRRALAKALAAP